MALIILGAILIAWALIAPMFFTLRTSDDDARLIFSQHGLNIKIDYVKINGRSIHYVMVGNDSLPTLAFLHGSPSSWRAFMEYMKDPELLKHYRIISIDRPGFGYSNFGNARNLQDQVRYILPVFNIINNNKPLYLAGHSLGAALVIQMAASAPKEFSGIMLISGSVDPGLEPKEKWRYAMEIFPLNYLLPGSFRPSNTELLYFKKDVVALATEFNKVSCAVYLVHGDKDSWVPPANVDYAIKKLIHASKIETLILPGGTHFVPWTNKKEITEELLKMLNSH